MTINEIRALDLSHMYDLIRNFPDQAREAIEIGHSTPIKLRAKGIAQVVMCGLGGSAIGGDLLRTYLAGELTIPFLVNRNYALPRFVHKNTLVIVSSYSGNTEETIAAHKEALRRRAKLLCISSNGVTERLARRYNTPLLTIPGGLPPRTALGYSFFPLLIALTKIGFIGKKDREIKETVALLEEKAVEYANPDPSSNKALQLAELLRGRIGVVYSSTDHFDAVNTRWRGQIAENAKSLLFGHVVPEMNHNEIVGWKALRDEMREMQVFFLRDRGDHKRVQMRMDITKEILSGHTPRVTEVWSEGVSLLARMFSLIYLGDWVSFYLAMLHKEDPTPVAAIDYLKHELGKV